jgi:hypothetical protein
MAVEQILQKEINKSKRSLDLETEESTYKRDLQKRIELLSWTLENMISIFVSLLKLKCMKLLI